MENSSHGRLNKMVGGGELGNRVQPQSRIEQAEAWDKIRDTILSEGAKSR
jgi:hypothetical protein